MMETINKEQQITIGYKALTDKLLATNDWMVRNDDLQSDKENQPITLIRFFNKKHHPCQCQLSINTKENDEFGDLLLTFEALKQGSKGTIHLDSEMLAHNNNIVMESVQSLFERHAKNENGLVHEIRLQDQLIDFDLIKRKFLLNKVTGKPMRSYRRLKLLGYGEGMMMNVSFFDGSKEHIYSFYALDYCAALNEKLSEL